VKNQQFIAKLRERGFRVTPQRLAICEFALSSKEHPTVDHVYQAVGKEYPTLSLATVYQTLHMLVAIGLLQELGFGDGISRYEPNKSPHINVVCKNCGKIQDYESESVRKFLSQIKAELNRTLIGQHLEIYTYCDQCKKKKLR
jgi:Fur family peroxide stress response transcriptional regulator